MRDIPFFTTQYGAASLTLREIPYQATAYVRIQASVQPKELIEECVSFCRVCGAEQIYATGHDFLEEYPRHAAIVKMQCLREQLPDSDACLWPVTEETLSNWLKIYNQKIQSVPNAAWMNAKDGKQMLQDGDGYFVHRNGSLIGIGRTSGDTVKWIASLEKGCGRSVLLALAQTLFTDTVALEVASTNTKAVRLYESLGFVPVAELSRWYKIY